MTIEQAITWLLEKGSYTAALLIFIVGGLKQWWVWGWLYRDKTRECDQWRTLALQGTSLANRAVSLAEVKKEDQLP